MKKIVLIILVFLGLLIEFTSCKKDKLLTDPSAKLSFSSDSVFFDTVFTTIGSATRHIRVINKNSQRILISSISLQNGSSSPFILNVDGAPGKDFSEIEIAANDSIFIFIQVNVNPNNQNSPLVISDQIRFTMNGNTQTVHLEAWGQDAYYHKPTNAIKFANGGYLPYSLAAPGTNTTITWNKDKPHVIYGWLVVDSSQTLIINAGVKVYLHQNAGLWVYRYGTLKVKGAYNNEVTFQGDRFESELANIPGQWDRIWINEGSLENEIDYAIIKNGFIGVQAELFGQDFFEPKRLKITNTVIQNMNKWGIYGLAFNIYGGNNIISNCKEHCGNFTLGGKYTFIHTTFANYWDEDERNVAAVHIDNATDTQILPMDSCFFMNCIIDGDQANELDLNLNTSGTSTLQPVFKFSHCLIKNTVYSSNNGSTFINCKFNQDPKFNGPKNFDFKLGENSAALDFGLGTTSYLFPYDIRQNPRTSSPDAGANEK